MKSKLAQRLIHTGEEASDKRDRGKNKVGDGD